MHSLELADRVTVETRSEPGLEVVCGHPEVPTGAENLGARAAALLAHELGIRPALRIRIESRIPVGGGLAAGSSVAAAVLRACCRLWDVPPDAPPVLRAARATGADVTFCLFGGAARARGIGELLTPLPPWRGLPLVLVEFPFRVSSAWAYEAYDLLDRPPRVDVDAAERALLRRDAAALGAAVANALEAATAARHPEVAAARLALRDVGALGAAMSGSGPTVFGVFATERAARRAAAELARRGYRAFVTRLAGEATRLGVPAPLASEGAS